jgi:hypothetical protein
LACDPLKLYQPKKRTKILSAVRELKKDIFYGSLILYEIRKITSSWSLAITSGSCRKYAI